MDVSSRYTTVVPRIPMKTPSVDCATTSVDCATTSWTGKKATIVLVLRNYRKRCEKTIFSTGCTKEVVGFNDVRLDVFMQGWESLATRGTNHRDSSARDCLFLIFERDIETHTNYDVVREVSTCR